MAINVTSYTPKFRIVIIDLALRNFTAIDTNSIDGLSSAFKASIHTINTVRRIGDPAQFSISLYPTPTGFTASATAGINKASWEHILNPMNYVTIYFSDPESINSDGMTIVFRGFISSITRSLDISSGTPQEMITINGGDWEKIAMFPIYNNYLAQNNPTIFSVDIIKAWNDTINSLAGINGLLNPFTPSQLMQEIFGDATSGFFMPVAAKIANAISAAVKFNPTPGPQPINTTLAPTLYDSTLTDRLEVDKILTTFNPIVEISSIGTGPFTSIMEIFRAYQAAPWRELFFDDYENGQHLIYKPAFWYDISGQALQVSTTGSDLELVFDPGAPVNLSLPLTIGPKDYISYSLSRSDTNVQNIFATCMLTGEAIVNFQLVAAGVGINMLNPIIVGSNSSPFKPSDVQIFGARPMIENSIYLDYGPNVQAIDVNGQQNNTISTNGGTLNLLLTSAMNHNELLSEGTITLEGYPSAHMGVNILFQKDATNTASRFYLEGVAHAFTQPSNYGDGSFLTTLTVTRGEDYLDAGHRS